MKIAVVGTGYVGLVTGTCFAEMGNQVVCIDVDEAKVKKMQAGEVPIYEPDLDKMFTRNVQNGRLTFSIDLTEGVKDAEVIFLALPTPPGEDGSADLSYVLDVAEKLSHIINKYVVIVNKSTVPVGTAEKVRKTIANNTDLEFDVASNPEFLREGFAVTDFMKPDRVIIGSKSIKARKVLKKLYEPFVRQGNPIIVMDERSAELTKYAANSFLATKISFMNEIANLCETVGANVDNVRIGIGADERIGRRFLFPGIGYGGSCFPKDVMALNHTAKQYNYEFKILDAVQDVNKLQKTVLIKKMLFHFNGDLSGKVFALWGLAFKPDTDDIREAPALEIIDSLLENDAKVVAYDPEAGENVRKKYGNKDGLQILDDAYLPLNNADALIIATEWGVFRTPDFDRMNNLMNGHAIFDGRNIFDPDEVERHGFTYYSIGRPHTKVEEIGLFT